MELIFLKTFQGISGNVKRVGDKHYPPSPLFCIMPEEPAFVLQQAAIAFFEPFPDFSFSHDCLSS